MRLFRTDRRGNPIPWFQRKRPARRHPHLPQLFYLVQNQSWPLVVQRARSHPHEVVVQEDGTGNTVLHNACRLDPPANVVQALRDASLICNTEGAIPLHIAATHRCSADAIQILLKEEDGQDGISPAAILTRMGRAPIHYACFCFRGLSLAAFQLLLEATLASGHVAAAATADDLEDLMEDDEYSQFDDAHDQETTHTMNVVTLRDSTGQTPLGLLFRRYRERVRIVISSMERLHPLAAALRVQADLGELWEKARWIVARLAKEAAKKTLLPMEGDIMLESPGEQAIAQEAAKWASELYIYSPPSTTISTTTHAKKRPQFRIVHASCSLTGYGCPPEMILLALSIHPHQAKEMDQDGSLPLHVCAMAPSLVYNDRDDSSFLSEFSFFSATTTTATTTGAFSRVLKILLQHYPAAARVPHGASGKLPLTLALEGRTWDDGIQTLLDAYPAALESKKFPLAMYPHILSRVGNRSSGRKSHTAIYELLKAKPDLVME